MAIGDVVATGTKDIADGASLTFQPAAGVEVVITQIGGALAGAAPNRVPDVTVRFTDGTDQFEFMDDLSSPVWGNLRMFITNTFYLDILNSAGGNANLSFCGVTVNV